MTTRAIILGSLLLPVLLSACTPAGKQPETKNQVMEEKIDSILSLMTLEEKIGQMHQLHRNRTNPNNPVVEYEYDITVEGEIRKGNVGTLLKVLNLEEKIRFQKMAVEESRTGIPLIMANDLIHGYKTIFPIPLAQAASWDMEAIEKSCRMAAMEATASGLHWTFSPMIDVTRDPRWGRIMEGPGEDPYLGSRFAEAMVKGYQGRTLSETTTVASCPKHYAGYGGVESGKDYNTNPLSVRQMREIYLPPFKAAFDAGAVSTMTGFIDFNGVPVTANKLLLRKILRDEWNFDGVVISDYNSIEELIMHGVAANRKESARQAVEAGVDIDMMSFSYLHFLKNLVQNGQVEEKLIDESVRRILRLKYKLGLFDDPYRYFDVKRRDTTMMHPMIRKQARDMARKSMVLLKNKGKLLPVDESINSIALIGFLADDQYNMLGSWACRGEPKDVITLKEGLGKKLGDDVKIYTAQGYSFDDAAIARDRMVMEAIAAARKAELVILTLGEQKWMTGEGSGKANIGLPGKQLELAKTIMKLNKPVVAVIFGGRPLTIRWIKEHVPSILMAWWPGTEAGNALADVLTGDCNPSGKLPVSFPYHVGQIPVYHSYKSTGRPYDGRYGTKFQDIPNEPLFPFGYGLSYTNFEFSGISLNKEEISFVDTLKVSVEVTNTGQYEGAEVVQVYIRDLVAEVTRPVKELKGFKKISLEPGQTKRVIIPLTVEDLKYWNCDMEFVAGQGEFEVFAGPHSANLKKTSFRLVE